METRIRLNGRIPRDLYCERAERLKYSARRKSRAYRQRRIAADDSERGDFKRNYRMLSISAIISQITNPE